MILSLRRNAECGPEDVTHLMDATPRSNFPPKIVRKWLKASGLVV